jgi:environmental stress-induced protein Ves
MLGLSSVWSVRARRASVGVVAMASLTSCGGGESTEPVVPQFTVGGSITGLTGTGLVLWWGGGTDLPVSAGASSFTMPGSIAKGALYAVNVRTQPINPSQNCVVGTNSGVANANVANVVVTCTTNSFTVGGSVSGLTGSGLALAINGGTPQSISAGAVAFAFPAMLSGASYTVTVATQPTAAAGVPAQSCTVTNGTGVVGASNVTSIAVSCVTLAYTLGGSITGLVGSGLVLQNNGANDVSVAAGATSFAFASSVVAGSPYAVTVRTQPSNPSQTCTVANGAGTATANVLVAVSCVSNTLSIGGTVSGLSGNGLSLLLNGATPLTIAAGATTFLFPSTVATGLAYAVTIASHPAGQTCSVINGTGVVGTTGVTTIVIVCTTNAANTFTVGGTITGLTAPGLVLLLNGASPLTVAPGATTFAFAASASGSAYTVSVGTQPGTLNCTVANAAGTVGTANITTVTISCVTVGYTIGGTITGYTGTGLRLLINGGTGRTIATGGATFEFPALPSGTAYAVTVGTQPNTPTQLCTVSNGTGTVGNANVTNILVSCVNTFAVTGTLTNLNANGLVLLLNGGSPLPRAIDNGTFSFTGLPTGTPYSITIGTQPSAPSQTCTVSNGSGVVGSANVTNVTVLCINGGPIVGGNISGYTGTGLTLRINGGAPFTPQSRTRFSFPDFYPPGTEFAVSIEAQPAGQSCTLIRGAGVILPAGGPNNVQNIAVQCTTNSTSPLSGTYTMRVGGKQNYLTLWPDGTYSYASRLDDPSCSGTTGNGVEYGVYNYNASTGAFAFLTGAVDTNGRCGVFNNEVSAQVGLSGTLVKSGSTLTLTTPAQSLVFTAVTSTAGGLIGSYQSAGLNTGEFIVLQTDNTYLVVSTQANGPAGNGMQVGYERGCFTSTVSTITFTLATSCKPDGADIIDTNGKAGLSDGGLNVPLSYLVTGPNTLTLAGDSFLVRIMVN